MARPQKAPALRRRSCLLVRHGLTPTTGKILPGRAAGLHLADSGQAQAKARRRSASPRWTVSTPCMRHHWSGRARPPHRSPTKSGLKVQIDKGLLECDFGEWTGAELKKLMKLPEWDTVQRAPSTFRFPGGESFTEMQTRMVATIDRLRVCPRGWRRSCASRMPTRSRPRSPTPWERTSTCSNASSSVTCSISAIAYGTSGPVVLTVNSTGGSLAELRPS